jgi:hypothetical protein
LGATKPVWAIHANIVEAGLLHYATDLLFCTSAENPHHRFLKRPISVCIFGNGLLVLDGRPFLLNFSEFLHGDAVQEHHDDEILALEKQFSVAETTVQNCKTLSMGSNPIVASESKRFTEKFR